MGKVFAFGFTAVAGYALGVWSSSDFRNELVTVKAWISGEISAIHSKLNAILAAVKK
jgi:hypothetical protein